jgi:predicted Rossmann fold flavoprotein
VVVLDHAKKIAEKIRISGGGRCNFTNQVSGPANFLSLNPGFPDWALQQYRPQDFIDLVRSHRIPFHEKHSGQLFCDRSSQDIIDLLLAESAKGAVSIRYPVEVFAVTREAAHWQISLRGLDSLRCRQLVVATGGMAVPAIGASAWGLDFARSQGLEITPVRAGLVPMSFTSMDQAWITQMPGLSHRVSISVGEAGHGYGQASFLEDALMTHKGLSGPAVLQASNYWEQGQAITVDWLAALPQDNVLDERAIGRFSVHQLLEHWFPKRLATGLALCLGDDYPVDRKWAELGRALRERLVNRLRGFSLKPAGHLGWNKAEVMRGGVCTKGLDPRTMQSRRDSSLYFIGEVVDVTGHLGGHNFQWAWASASCCATAITTQHAPDRS